jgi:hypothetical protein
VTATGCKIYSPCGYVNVLGQDSFVQKPKITIHPNPAQNILNLETDEDILETNIYDMMGRRTHHEILNKNINVQHLSDGLYLLEVKTTLGTYQEKFLKN